MRRRTGGAAAGVVLRAAAAEGMGASCRSTGARGMDRWTEFARLGFDTSY
jgi:hypothetical protein